MDAAQIAEATVRHGLIGCNIHYHDGEWSVWTRHKDREGWSRSGRHADLAVALAEAFGREIDIIRLEREADDLI